MPYGIDTGVFKPAQTKREAIAYLPRKRPIEANYLRNSFRHAFPDLRGWDWWPLVNESEANVAAAMGEAGVFLSLGRLESLGLTPLEAMACGCIVAGFTGIGGQEYASPANGFWAAEDDFPSCIKQLRAAVELAQSNKLPRVAYHEMLWGGGEEIASVADVDRWSPNAKAERPEPIPYRPETGQHTDRGDRDESIELACGWHRSWCRARAAEETGDRRARIAQAVEPLAGGGRERKATGLHASPWRSRPDTTASGWRAGSLRRASRPTSFMRRASR